MLERMHDNISNDPNFEPYVLWRLKEDSTKTSGLPGLPVRMRIVFLLAYRKMVYLGEISSGWRLSWLG